MESTWIGLAAIGLYGTWGRTWIDGSLDRLFVALRTGTLPGVGPGQIPVPLRTRVTGLYWPFDFLLSVLIIFFWEAADGSHPTTSLLGIYFLGQHLSIITVMYINSYRATYPRDWKMSATLWLAAFQLTGIATSGPVFASWYLASIPMDGNGGDARAAPVPSSLIGIDLSAIACLPFSIALGYVLPAILMQLPSPSLVSESSQQLWIALWNLFPLFIVVVQKIGMAIAPPQASAPAAMRLKTRPAFPQVLRITYGIAFFLSTIVHIACLALCLTSHWFPMVLAPQYVSAFHLGKVLVPPTRFGQVDTMGQGVQSFFQWDQLVGYVTMLILASKYNVGKRDRMERRHTFIDFFTVVMASVLVGPGSVVLGAHWAADETEFVGRVDALKE